MGQVFETKFPEKTQATFIDMEGLYPNTPLSIVIFGKARENFKEGPETLYKGKQICVTGVVKEYKNRIHIVATKLYEVSKTLLVFPASCMLLCCAQEQDDPIDRIWDAP